MTIKPLKQNLASVFESFPSYHRIDIATGYFSLRGWSSIDPLVRESFETGDVDGPIESV